MITNNELICPACKTTMIKGFIQSGNRLAWVPHLSKVILEPSLIKGSVLLSQQNRFSVNYVDAFLCKNCKKVIVNYD